jgi:plasmid stabilization system protein ParE
VARLRRVSLAAQARIDLRKTYDWYEAQSTGLGPRFTRAFVQAVESATERPTSFPEIEGDLRRVILSRFPFGVFFRIVGDVIRVIRVIDLRSDDHKWRDDLRRIPRE